MPELRAAKVQGPTVPWWQEEAPPDEELPALEETMDADVAIVGGGLTGLWAALELRRARPWARVVVLEAARCGDGASARDGGVRTGSRGAAPPPAEVLGGG